MEGLKHLMLSAILPSSHVTVQRINLTPIGGEEEQSKAYIFDGQERSRGNGRNETISNYSPSKRIKYIGGNAAPLTMRTTLLLLRDGTK